MIDELLKKIIELQKEILYFFGIEKRARDKLFLIAKSMVGQDLSVIATNTLGCAESLSRVIKQVYPQFLIRIDTPSLFNLLSNMTGLFRRVNTFEPGTIIITVSDWTVKENGHCGILVNPTVVGSA